MAKKIVAIASSDWHLNNWKNYNENDRRIKNGLKMVLLMHQLCNKKKVPLLFPGDLFHNDQALHNKLLHYVFPVFDQVFNHHNPLQMYGIDGNHDQSEQNNTENHSPSYFCTFASVFRGMHCLNFNSAEFKDFVVHGIPYITKNKDFSKIVNAIKLSKKRKNILMIHTDLPGAKDTNQRVVGTAHNIPERLSELFARFDLVLCGHIHKAQIMDKNVIMVGANQQQRKTDIGCKMGYWEIYEDMSYKFVSMDNFPEFEVVEKVPEKGSNYYIIEKKKSGKMKELEKENNRDFNVLMSRNKLVSNYCKTVGDIPKENRVKLKELLSNA